MAIVAMSGVLDCITIREVSMFSVHSYKNNNRWFFPYVDHFDTRLSHPDNNAKMNFYERIV